MSCVLPVSFLPLAPCFVPIIILTLSVITFLASSFVPCFSFIFLIVFIVACFVSPPRFHLSSSRPVVFSFIISASLVFLNHHIAFFVFWGVSSVARPASLFKLNLMGSSLRPYQQQQQLQLLLLLLLLLRVLLVVRVLRVLVVLLVPLVLPRLLVLQVLLVL